VILVASKSVVQPIQRILEDLHSRYLTLNEGEVATYIPELAKANPDHFGIAIAALDGYVYTVGECDVPFTIQSISKPFVYGMALEDNGFEAVLSHVGVEPTGDAFNAISLDPDTGRPANPMINAGAIASTSLIAGTAGEALERLLAMFGRYAGHDLDVDKAVYLSESETGHRNRAIAHMLRNFDIVSASPERGLDLYFQQCSISVTCRDLAVMAATLANRGVNPITDVRALDADYVDSVLSVMGSCGMYNFAGEWIYRVGMPAKSGVSGGILACLAGQLGIGVYSPRLDERGNSARGVGVCGDLSNLYSLHIHNAPNVTRACLRSRYSSADVRSKRQRTRAEAEILNTQGQRVRIYELQGHLNFASVEFLSRQVVADAPETDLLAIDMKRTLHLDPGGATLLQNLLRDLLTAGKLIAVSDSEHVSGFADSVESLARTTDTLFLADNLDAGMEWCEDHLIATLLPSTAGATKVELIQNQFFEGLGEAVVARLTALCVQSRFDRGSVLIQAGYPCTSMFFLVGGEVSATVDLPFQEHVRLATYSAGMAFGFGAALGKEPQEADYVADTDIECYLLGADDIDALATSDPALIAAMYRKVALYLENLLDEATIEIRTLAW
jgi:glutaminase